MAQKQPLPIDERFWAKTVKAAIGTNPIRIFVELITNSADSYERLDQQGLAKPPHKISVKYLRPFKKVGIVEVKDDAEGMTAEQLWDALRYGAATSGLREGLAVRGAMGFGLKDACMAMKESTILSVKEGKISEFEVIMEKGKPYVIPFRENEPVLKEERAKLGLTKNGTIVKGFLSKNFPRLKSDQFIEQLGKHFMMRRLLQLPDYEVLITHGRRLEPPHHLTYVPPIGKTLKQEEFDLVYPGLGKFRIKMMIKKAYKDLRVTGECKETGLIHYHDKYAVVDCTLWGFENDPFARRLFGEVEIIGFSEFLKRDEDVIDEKRRGLNRKHLFISELVREIENRLRPIIEEERKASSITDYSLDTKNLKKTLRELNKIAKEEGALGKFMPPSPEYWTESISFYPPYIEVFEYLEKRIHLVINPSIIKSDSIVYLTSSRNEIEVNPKQIRISALELEKDKCFSHEIRVLASKPEIEGEIASQINEFFSTAGVKVHRNPMLYPKSGFTFVPDETKIVDGNKKNTNLMIELATLKEAQASTKIQLESTNSHIQCPSELHIPENVQPYFLSPNVIRIRVPIKAAGEGERGSIIAQFGVKKAKLHVTVVSPFETHGLFKEIEFTTREDVKEISYFDRNEGIIYVYSKHPVMKKYIDKPSFKRSAGFLVFAADTVARLICWEIIKEKERKGSLEILNPENRLQELQIHFSEIYYKRGINLHGILAGLIKTLKIRR